MKFNLSKTVLVLFLMVLVLLPFSRLAELPILILSITGLVGLIKHKNSLVQDNSFKILSLIYFCYLGMILISATDSYWQNKTLIVGLASLRFYLSSIALLLYLKSEDFKLLNSLIAVLIIFWAFDAIFQYFVGFNTIGRTSYEGRLNGIFGEHHAKLGPVLALFLPAVMIAMKKHNTIMRWIVTIAIIITIILSGTRSAWIMMLFILIAYWFHHVKTRRFILLFKTVAVSIVLITSLWFISSEFQQRIQRSIAAFDGSQSGLDFALANRLPIWTTSLAMIQQHPINGVGAHAFRKAYPQFAQQGDVWQAQGGVGMHAHHWVLEVLSDTGIIGLLLFGYALLRLYHFVRNNYSGDYTWIYLIAIISAFLPITSTYSIFASFWSICLWFCGTGVIIMSKKDE